MARPFICKNCFSSYLWDFTKTFGASATGWFAALAYKQVMDSKVMEANNIAQNLMTEKIIRTTVNEYSQEIYEQTVPTYLRWILPKSNIVITIPQNQPD